MTKSLLIFDLDGTLLDSISDLTAALNAALVINALPCYPTATVRHWVGNGAYVLCRRALADTAWADNDDKIDKVHHDFLHCYANQNGKEARLYDGVAEGLSALKNHGYRLGLATNKPCAFLPSILTHYQLSAYFEVVVGGDTLAQKKPDPAPLLYICRQLEVAPHQAVMIGDSDNDIQAGKRAGMATLGLSYGYNYGKPISESCPDKVFDNFASLCQYLLGTVA